MLEEIGLDNLRRVYIPRVDQWQLFDNSGGSPTLLEEGTSS